MDANGDLTVSYDGFGPDASNTNTAQRATNNLVTDITYTEETLTFAYQSFSYPISSATITGPAVGGGYFRLTVPGIGTTANIPFLDPTIAGNPALNATAMTNALHNLSPLLTSAQVTYNPPNPLVANSYTYLVNFNAAAPISAAARPAIQFAAADSTESTIPVAMSATFLGLNTAALGLARQQGDDIYDPIDGEANGALFSQFDADPRLKTQTGQTSFALTSDDVANATRDGQDSTYYLELDPYAINGGFTLNLTVPNGVYSGPETRIGASPDTAHWRSRRRSTGPKPPSTPTRPPPQSTRP